MLFPPQVEFLRHYKNCNAIIAPNPGPCQMQTWSASGLARGKHLKNIWT
jgi:hypothetical protein